MVYQKNRSDIILDKKYICSLELVMDMIGGKWKPLMLYHLKEGALRSGDLQRCLPGITNKMFTQTARDLESVRLIKRTVFPVVPPKVEYELTEQGKSIIYILAELATWGDKLLEKTDCDNSG